MFGEKLDSIGAATSMKSHLFWATKRNTETLFIEDRTPGILQELYSCLWEQKAEAKTKIVPFFFYAVKWPCFCA